MTSRPSSSSTPAASSCALICVHHVVDGGALLDDLADAADRLVEPVGDLAQRHDRGDEVVDEREHDQTRPPRSSRRRPRASAPPLGSVVDDDVERAAVVGHAGHGLLDLVLRGQEERGGVEVLKPAVAAAAIRWALGTLPSAASSTPRSRWITTGRITSSRSALPITRASSRPPLGHDRGLAPDARQRAEDHVELGVDRLHSGLERAQVLGLDALERGGERGEVARGAPRAPGAP